MRRAFKIALATAAVGFSAAAATPAQAAVILVKTFSGNQCTGGGITTCYASGTTAGSGSLTQVGNGPPAPGSPGIFTTDQAGTSDDFTVTFSGGNLSFTYSPEAGDPVIHYFGVFQGGSGLNCSDCNNTYQLFYSATPLTSGSIKMSDYFTNSDSWSHIDFFDGGAVPEPGTWGMMLLGFAGIGIALRRRRRSGALMQIA